MLRLQIDFSKLYNATSRKQSAIAKALKVSQSTVSKFVNGKSGGELDFLNDVCQAIDIDTLNFLQHVESIPRR